MTDGAALPPGLLLIASGLLCLVLPRWLRGLALIAAPVLTLIVVRSLASDMGVASDGPFAGQEIYATTREYLGLVVHPVRVDALGLTFATVFAVMALIGALFALTLEDPRELAILQVYAGTGIGAVLAGDLLTLFVFWELMAIASVLIIWAGGPAGRGPGLRYAGVHFLGGALLMAGAAGYVATTGETVFTALPQEGVIGGLILIAFLINAAAWPFNAWLADAYPKASVVGTVFLSAFTTKTAIYALIRGFPGDEWLIWLGVATILYGCLYALAESDIRRLLCYAIVAQGGFMMVGVGVGTPMSLNGAAGHAAMSILYSATLFVVAGWVIQTTGRDKVGDLGGLALTMPRTCVIAVLAGLCIAAFPGTGSYVSKSLITSGTGSAGFEWAWLALVAAAVGVALHGLARFQWLTFFGRDRGLSGTDPGGATLAAMVLPLLIMVAVALAPSAFYAGLPYEMKAYTPYHADTVLLQIELVLAGVAAFAVAWRVLPAWRGGLLDTDWFYRDAGHQALVRASARWLANWNALGEIAGNAIRGAALGIYRLHGPDGVLGRTRPTGNVALWMTVLLGLLLVFTVV